MIEHLAGGNTGTTTRDQIQPLDLQMSAGVRGTRWRALHESFTDTKPVGRPNPKVSQLHKHPFSVESQLNGSDLQRCGIESASFQIILFRLNFVAY